MMTEDLRSDDAALDDEDVNVGRGMVVSVLLSLPAWCLIILLARFFGFLLCPR